MHHSTHSGAGTLARYQCFVFPLLPCPSLAAPITPRGDVRLGCLLNLRVFSLLSPAQISLVGSTGLTNTWCLRTRGCCGSARWQKRLPAWYSLLPLTTQTGVRCEGPAAHWGCLPTLALPGSLITPGCICGGDGGAEAPFSGEGPVAASVCLFPPLLG